MVFHLTEIRKSSKNNGAKANFHCYRDSSQNEIDLIILGEGALHFIECRPDVNFNKSDIKRFSQPMVFNYETGNSFVLRNAQAMYKIGEKAHSIPISALQAGPLTKQSDKSALILFLALRIGAKLDSARSRKRNHSREKHCFCHRNEEACASA